MKWLTTELIKSHCRIDSNTEDALLEMYGESAEQVVMDVLGRDYTEIVERWGEVPRPLVHASLLLVSQSYQMREAVSMQNMYAVPYGFDLMVKPYMRLASGDPDADATGVVANGKTNNKGYGCNSL